MPYKTNIYTLYNEMFSEGNPESMDIIQVLKEREKDSKVRCLLDENFSDILLIFDFDPQAPDFSPNSILEMLAYFKESSDMGKLYINYPMVESFYHMKSIPDSEYNFRKISMSDIKKYKTIVHDENRNKDYTKFAINKDECSAVIRQNIEKGRLISHDDFSESWKLPDGIKILNKELQLLNKDQSVNVLCTCAYYIADYNSNFIL